MVDLLDVPPVIAGQPGAQDQEADAERQQVSGVAALRDARRDARQQVSGVEPIEEPAAQRQQRKSAHPARPHLSGLGMELLEGEAEEKSQTEQQEETRDR